MQRAACYSLDAGLHVWHAPQSTAQRSYSPIHISIHGKHADPASHPISSRHASSRACGLQEAFERGQVDTFQFKLRQLGRLTKLIVMHDNAGTNPGWQLLKVVVTSNLQGEKVSTCTATAVAGTPSVCSVYVYLPAPTAPQTAACSTLSDGR